LKWDRSEAGVFHLTTLSLLVSFASFGSEFVDLLHSAAPHLESFGWDLDYDDDVDFSIEAKALAKLFTLSSLSHVTLHLPNDGSLSQLVPSLSSAPSLTSLSVNVSESCSEELAKALAQSSITSLHWTIVFDHRDLNCPQLRHTLASPRLKTLSLSRIDFSQEFGNFCSALVSCPSLTSLRFSFCLFDDISPLTDVLVKLSLVGLHFFFAESDLQLLDLARVIPRTKLQSLELSNFSWSVDEMTAFVSLLPSMNLHSLSLMFRCNFDNQKVSLIPLFEPLSRSCIRDFRLACGISHLGKECLQLLSNSQVSCLRMPFRVWLGSSVDRFCLSLQFLPDDSSEDTDEEDDA
jgi:hypothetical protein